jgi:hypothetical protein
MHKKNFTAGCFSKTVFLRLEDGHGRPKKLAQITSQLLPEHAVLLHKPPAWMCRLPSMLNATTFFSKIDSMFILFCTCRTSLRKYSIRLTQKLSFHHSIYILYTSNPTFQESNWDIIGSNWHFDTSKWTLGSIKLLFKHVKWDFQEPKWDFRTPGFSPGSSTSTVEVRKSSLGTSIFYVEVRNWYFARRKSR